VATADPTAADCRTRYRAAHDSGRRGLAQVKWVVLHSTEGGTAEAVARYFSTPAASGSAHLVVDDNACYRCLPNDVIPWAAPGANAAGFHIEQAAFAQWAASAWLRHRPMLERGAYKAAYHCLLFGVPPYFVKADGLRRGMRGVTTHAECTRAFGGTHTDPGDGWPRSFFMDRLRAYFDELREADVRRL
jgi:hypothetical protein